MSKTASSGNSLDIDDYKKGWHSMNESGLTYPEFIANIERQARISELEMLVKQNKFPCNTLELQQYLMNRTAELEREE